MIKLTLSQRLLERADASDEDCRTDDGDIMREADDALKAKDAEIETLRDALKPFADCCPKTENLWDNDDRWDAHVSVGEMRAARSAVKEKADV